MNGKLSINIDDLERSLSPKAEEVLPVDPFKQERDNIEKAFKQERDNIEKEHGVISAASNTSDSKENYIGRSNYRKLFNTHKENLIDTWYEDSYYGKVDIIGNLIVPKNNMVNVGTDDKPMYLLKFAASAFKSLLADYSKKKINKNKTKHLREVNPVVGQASAGGVEENYKTYMERFYDEFLSSALRDLKESGRIISLGDFVRELMSYVRTTEKVFTFPSYVESSEISEYDSGLIIDILDISPDDDKQKIEFFDDINYAVYEYVAKTNGFKIDPNIPWRLIADMRSSFMRKFYEEKFASPQIAYTANFNKVGDYSRSFEKFKKELDLMHIKFLEENPHYLIDTIEGGKPILNKVPRTPHNENQNLIEDYVEWYILFRVAESKVTLQSSVLKDLVLNGKQLYRLSNKRDEPVKTELRDRITHLVEYTIGTPVHRKSSQLTGGSKSVIFLGRAIE